MGCPVIVNKFSKDKKILKSLQLLAEQLDWTVSPNMEVILVCLVIFHDS